VEFELLASPTLELIYTSFMFVAVGIKQFVTVVFIAQVPNPSPVSLPAAVIDCRIIA
jgi:hypothetical protein